MSVGVRRSEIEIVRDILRLDEGGSAEVRCSANLSHAQMLKYLSFLEKSDLIGLKRDGSRGILFKVRPKGQMVLKQLDQLFEIMGLDSWSEAGI